MMAATSSTGAAQPLLSQGAGMPVTSEEVYGPGTVAQGRSFGYQPMLSGIRPDTVQVERERAQAIRAQNAALCATDAFAGATLTMLPDPEGPLSIGRANTESQEALLDRGRTGLFPCLDQIMRVGE